MDNCGLQLGAMQAAKETKDALETLQSNMETKKKKHKKKHDKGEKIRAEGKQVTTTEDEVPMKQEQQSSDDEKPQVSSAMDEKAESPTTSKKEKEPDVEGHCEEEGTEKMEDLQDPPLSPASVPCFCNPSSFWGVSA